MWLLPRLTLIETRVVLLPSRRCIDVKTCERVNPFVFPTLPHGVSQSRPETRLLLISKYMQKMTAFHLLTEMTPGSAHSIPCERH
jgi:hypothetical protein